MQIIPSLWFDTQTEEAITLYSAAFPNSRKVMIKRYPETGLPDWMTAMAGKVLTAVFELAGQTFIALDGGPKFKFTPAASLMINASSAEEVERLWEVLSPGGTVLMPLGAYPFSEKFGWLSDKFGLSWQIMAAPPRKQKITPFLMFVGDQYGRAEEAIRLYMSLFENSALEHLERYTDADENEQAGTVKHAVFQLNGQDFMAIDSGFAHDFNFNEAFSLSVECDTQEEVDRLWNALSAVPEAEACGWLKDKFGVSWQITPRVLGDLMSDPDPEKAQRTMDAMLQMKKLDIAELKRAHAGQR